MRRYAATVRPDAFSSGPPPAERRSGQPAYPPDAGREQHQREEPEDPGLQSLEQPVAVAWLVRHLHVQPGLLDARLDRRLVRQAAAGRDQPRAPRSEDAEVQRLALGEHMTGSVEGPGGQDPVAEAGAG